MRQHSDQLPEILTGSYERDLSVNVFNGSDRMLEGIRFESWQLDSNLSRGICSFGSGTVVYSSPDGSSLVPVGTEGVLSPFRARVELVMTVTVGGVSESISLGLFRVASVPTASDSKTNVGGRELVVASKVALKFESLESDIDRWGFQFPEQSAAGVSAFSEIRRLTGMPVEETVPDATVPAVKVWEAKQGGRLEAVLELGRILGGSAVVNSRGAWEIIPDEIGAPVATLELGAQGTVKEIAAGIETDTVYNQVVGTYEAATGEPIYAIAEAPAGPLAPDGLYLRNTRYHESDLVKTKAQAQAAVDAVLAQSIGSQHYDVEIQCHVNPLVERGDVVELKGWDRPLIGQIRSVQLSSSPYMSVTLRASRRLL